MKPIQNQHLNAALSPENMQDDFTHELLHEDFGFIEAKRLEGGTYVGLMRLLFTVAICIGVDPCSAYRRRYCYKDLGACLAAYEALQTGDDVPAGWIARRPAHPDDYKLTGKPQEQQAITVDTQKKKPSARKRDDSRLKP